MADERGDKEPNTAQDGRDDEDPAGRADRHHEGSGALHRMRPSVRCRYPASVKDLRICNQLAVRPAPMPTASPMSVATGNEPSLPSRYQPIPSPTSNDTRLSVPMPIRA